MKKILLLLVSFALLASCGQAQNNSEKTTAPETQNVATGTTDSSPAPIKTTDVSVENVDKSVVMADARNIGQEAPTFGAGDHVIQIWADFQCPACQQADSTISPVLEKLADEGKLKIEYRQFPLTRIHPNAFADAAAAMCAQDQNKYFAYKKALYALEISRAGGKLGTSDYVKIAESLAMDTTAFESCVTGEKYKDYVTKSMEIGTKLGVSGTPTYILDGKPLSMGAFGTIEKFEEFMNKLVVSPVQQ